MKNSLPSKDPAPAALYRLGDEWIAKTCELFPESGSRWGFEDCYGLLGENSVPVHRKLEELEARLLHQIEDLPEAAFSGDAWLDRRGFLALLRTGSLFSKDLARWRTNPQQHADAAIGAVFELVVRAAESLAPALPNIEARLAKLPDFLAAGADCVRLPVPLWTELAEKSCAGSVEFLEGLAPELMRVSPHPQRTKSLVASAVSAFRDFARAIRRKRSGAKDGFAIGRDRFEFLIRERLGLDLSLREARVMGESLVAEHEVLLEREAAKHGRRSAREIIDAATAEWHVPSSLLAHYRQVTTEIKSRLATAELMSLPDRESLKVLPVPAFLRHQFPTAAYNPPQPFAQIQNGIFWVNDLSLTHTDPAKKIAEARQHFGLELTSIHEGYPGHHLQFVVQFQHPSRLRRLFEHSIGYEGWTMWCEKLAVDHGLVDFPAAKLVQLHDALWRAHRIVIDCGLQESSLTPTAAAHRLQRGLGFTPARAIGDVNWYSSSPTVPMSYLLGRLEVEKLHRWLVLGKGWTLKNFNDWLLSHGAMPPAWIRRAQMDS